MDGGVELVAAAFMYTGPEANDEEGNSCLSEAITKPQLNGRQKIKRVQAKNTKPFSAQSSQRWLCRKYA